MCVYVALVLGAAAGHCSCAANAVNTHTAQAADARTRPADSCLCGGGARTALGEKAIPGASAALRSLRARGCPLAFVTNGGGRTEARRALELAEILQLEGIRAEHVVQSHTPFAQLAHLHHRPVLAVGRGPLREILASYGFTKVVTPEQLGAAYPYIAPFRQFDRSPDGGAFDPAGEPLAGALVLTEPTDFHRDMQMLCDVIAGGGRPDAHHNEARCAQTGAQRVECVFSNGDLLWANGFAQPRFGQGAFRAALDAMFKCRTGGVGLQYTVFGKPEPAPYALAERALEAQAAEQGVTISAMYFVGDNPAADILGANTRRADDSRWRSLLVRSGVYRDAGSGAAFVEGSGGERPDVVADDVAGAIELVMRDSN